MLCLLELLWLCRLVFEIVLVTWIATAKGGWTRGKGCIPGPSLLARDNPQCQYVPCLLCMMLVRRAAPRVAVGQRCKRAQLHASHETCKTYLGSVAPGLCSLPGLCRKPSSCKAGHVNNISSSQAICCSCRGKLCLLTPCS